LRDADIDRLAAGLLSGRYVPWPRVFDGDATARFVQRSTYHGIAGLLADIVALRSDWPAPLRDALREQAVAQWLWHTEHEQVLRDALAALDHAGAQPIVFKGAALAYSHYSVPHARARADSDVLISPAALDAAIKALQVRGFHAAAAVNGTLVTTQRTFVRQAAGTCHSIDLHWQLSNSPVVAGLLSHEELARDSVPLRELGPGAVAAGAAHALLIAIVHRATHRTQPFYDGSRAYIAADRLVWLYDIHVLHSAMADGDRKRFSQLARRAPSACADALAEAHSRFAIAEKPLTATATRIPQPQDPISQYLEAGRVGQWWLDLGALGTSARRLAWLRETLFPGKDYMHARYGSRRPLPWMYARRAIGGIAKAVRSSQA
jgi:hypothetical protein